MTEDEKEAAEARAIWDELIKPRPYIEERLKVAQLALPGQALLNPQQFQNTVAAATNVDDIVDAAAALRAHKAATRRFVETARTQTHPGMDSVPDCELPPNRPRD